MKITNSQINNYGLLNAGLLLSSFDKDSYSVILHANLR